MRKINILKTEIGSDPCLQIDFFLFYLYTLCLQFSMGSAKVPLWGIDDYPSRGRANGENQH